MLSPRIREGIEPLADLFDLWLWDVTAALMGERVEPHWRDRVQHLSNALFSAPARHSWRDHVQQASSERSARKNYGTGRQLPEVHVLADPPPNFSLDGFPCGTQSADALLTGCDVESADQRRPSMDSDHCVLRKAWHSFVWNTTCREVEARFPKDYRVYMFLGTDPLQEKSYSMAELYIQLFRRSGEWRSGVWRSFFDDHKCEWISFVEALHKAAHEKLPHSSECRICKQCKSRGDSRSIGRWNFQAITYLWEIVADIVRKHGIAWSALRSVRPIATVSAMPSLPRILTVESIPLEEIRALSQGHFGWGQYITKCSYASREEAWEELNALWQEDREIRINVLEEHHGHKNQKNQRSDIDMEHDPGEKLILKVPEDGDKRQINYEGRVWRSITDDGVDKWTFQEDGTGITVAAELSKLSMGESMRITYPQLEAKLYRAMRTEYQKRKSANRKAAKAKASREDIPMAVVDLRIRGTNRDGKKVFTWGDPKRGVIQVEVTPRESNEMQEEEDSEHNGAAIREPTPERALRKMQKKVRSLHAKQARGEHSRIVAKAVRDSDFPQPQASWPAATGLPDSYSPALRTLDNPSTLQYVIDAFEYLSSIRLHYCYNCDEEWPVFDGEWPQSGVKWVGPKAGKCECIVKAGFLASDKVKNSCHRCEGPSAYKSMYSKENFQHLGERHPALSALTWYEALLIARVHPVMSVITMTATGLLCYAGHVCNYYQKVMEWVTSLPAVLRDKKWFFIKRRKSLSVAASGIRQKKPTTANRHRLEAGIKEALKFLPTVYKYSKISEAELSRFPAHGEQEMLDAEEVVDLKGQVYITQETFGKWFQKGVDWAKWPCAGTVHRYVVDSQGIDLRGAVADDTAWDMCCRLLMLSTEQNKLSTADLAQLLVYWLDDRQVPAQMGDVVYEGMVKELESRGKRNETPTDCVHGSLHGSSHGYI